MTKLDQAKQGTKEGLEKQWSLASLPTLDRPRGRGVRVATSASKFLPNFRLTDSELPVVLFFFEKSNSLTAT